jgi:hypothetical protein
LACPSRRLGVGEKDSEVIVDMTGPLFSLAAFAALDAFGGADRQFSPDLLKDSFNCHDWAQAWYRPRNDPW